MSSEFRFFEVVILNMFKEGKEATFKAFKESRTTVNQQIKILNKDLKIVFLTKEPNRNSLV